MSSTATCGDFYLCMYPYYINLLALPQTFVSLSILILVSSFTQISWMIWCHFASCVVQGNLYRFCENLGSFSFIFFRLCLFI